LLLFFALGLELRQHFAAMAVGIKTGAEPITNACRTGSEFLDGEDRGLVESDESKVKRRSNAAQ
jgi:hypothetical protein